MLNRRNFLKATSVSPLILSIPAFTKQKEYDTIYKIVIKNTNDEYHSVVSECLKYTIFYKIGKWHYPKVGRLFGFNSLKNVKHFSNFIIEKKVPNILVCLATDVKEQTAQIGWNYSNIRIENFWKINSKEGSVSTPRGTISCTSVKPLRFVTQEEWDEIN